MELPTVDITSEAFGARLAAILRAARQDQGRTLRAMAWGSRGSFRSSTLKALEAGQANLRGLDLGALASLYRLDLAALLQVRVPLVVDVPAGKISTAGVERSYAPGDQDGLLLAYLYLVRDLRDLREARSITLRREDVEVLASGLRADAAAVLDRLGELMGSTVTQRRSAVAMFAAGAALIVLSTGAVALDSGLYQPIDDGEGASEVAVVTLATADDIGERGDLGGSSDLAGGLESSSASSPDAAVTASELPSPAPRSSAAAAVVDAQPSVTPAGSPAASTGTDRAAPVVGDPAAGPAVDVPVADARPAQPSVPGVPEEADATPETPAPGGPVPEDAAPVDGQPDDQPPVDERPADAPPEDLTSGDLPADELPLDGPPVDGPPAGDPPADEPPLEVPPVDGPAEGGPPADAPPNDLPPVDDDPGKDVPPVDDDPSTDVPGSDEIPEAGDPERSDPERSDPERSDPERSDPEPSDPERSDPEPSDPEPSDPEPSDPEPSDPEPGDPEPSDPEHGEDGSTPPDGVGGTPGNSQGAGNTPNVGTPGNSGNPNAGPKTPVRGTDGQRPR